jgi:hypothetical protein
MFKAIRSQLRMRGWLMWLWLGVGCAVLIIDFVVTHR